MKVFVSWSGKYSKDVASILKKYLPCILQGLDVFMSKHDIESGERWGNKLASELSESGFGIICLADSNLTSPWMLFEAGALTKQLDGRACGLLLGNLSPTDVTGPLSQFQSRKFESGELLKLAMDLNKKMEKPLSESQLALIFAKWSGDIQNEYEQITVNIDGEPSKGSHREDRELLEEILTRVRGIGSKSSTGYNEKPESYLSHVVESISGNSKNVLVKVLEFRENGDIEGKNGLIDKYPDELDELSRQHLIKIEDGNILIKSEILNTASHWLA